MSRKSKRRGRQRKRRANAGSFQKGQDSRRHVFTPSDCRVGWLVANIKHPELREWLRMRLFVYYSERRKRDGAQAQDGRTVPARNGSAGGGERHGRTGPTAPCKGSGGCTG